MCKKPKVLIQIDPDEHPSVFDSIVAVDCDVDHLLTHGSVEPLDVREIVHGAMFTRGGKSLKNTAIFVGGSNVQTGEQILRSVLDCFFGPVRVSVMMDANGANTTSAAAVLTIQQHFELKDRTIAVLGATGSVGRRVCWLLAKAGARVNVASRSHTRAAQVCADLQQRFDSAHVTPMETDSPIDFQKVLAGCDAAVSAGAAGIELLLEEQWSNESLKVMVDLNAVPPVGVQGIDPVDAGVQKHGVAVYGAIGVGNLKMSIHKKSIHRLFETNDAVLDIDEIFEIGQQLNVEF